jgi:hypothetical protein
MRSFAVALGLLALAACSSSSSSGSSSVPCNQDPWECPSTQTCWPESLSAYACLNAGPGTLGATCQDTAGTPTCGAGLACFQSLTSSSSTGTCVAYCSTTDPSHACPSGQLCQTAALGGAGGPEFSICVSTSTGDDGGTPQGDGAAADAPGGGG